MAGTLTISTLSDGTNSTSSTNCIKGSAKAWVNFNGTGNSVRASYNCSSVTISSSRITVAFTNAMADANYVINGLTNYNNFMALDSTVTISTTGFTIFAIGANPNQTNTNGYNLITVFGN